MTERVGDGWGLGGSRIEDDVVHRGGGDAVQDRRVDSGLGECLQSAMGGNEQSAEHGGVLLRVDVPGGLSLLDQLPAGVEQRLERGERA